MKNSMKRFWGWLKSPFDKVEETVEMRDTTTMEIVQYQRPEEMRIMRWTANATNGVREDIEEAVQLGQASIPFMGIGLMYIGMMWIGLLVSVMFTMALSGAGLLAIMAVIWKITYTMVLGTLFLVGCYALFLSLALIVVKRGWKLFNRHVRREPMSWKDAFQNTVNRFVYSY